MWVVLLLLLLLLLLLPGTLPFGRLPLVVGSVHLLRIRISIHYDY